MANNVIDQLTDQMNEMIFPAVEEGDTAWLENYEFEYSSNTWIATGNTMPESNTA